MRKIFTYANKDRDFINNLVWLLVSRNYYVPSFLTPTHYMVLIIMEDNDNNYKLMYSFPATKEEHVYGRMKRESKSYWYINKEKFLEHLQSLIEDESKRYIG